MNPSNLTKADIKRPITLTLSNGHKAHGMTLDISEQGLSITYGASADIGSHIGLSFSLVTNKQTVNFDLKGQVTFCFLHGSEYHIGFAFENITDEQKQAINRFVEFKRLHK